MLRVGVRGLNRLPHGVRHLTRPTTDVHLSQRSLSNRIIILRRCVPLAHKAAVLLTLILGVVSLEPSLFSVRPELAVLV